MPAILDFSSKCHFGKNCQIVRHICLIIVYPAKDGENLSIISKVTELSEFQHGGCRVIGMFSFGHLSRYSKKWVTKPTLQSKLVETINSYGTSPLSKMAFFTTLDFMVHVLVL